MTDPMSLIALGAAVGGAVGKFTEKAWDQGEKWITSYFKDHGQKAQEKAKENSLAFLGDLSQRLKIVEKQNQENSQEIQDALSHPGFSILLQKAMLASAETDSKEKHEILSRLIADRLTKDSESIHALTSKMATDAISNMTTNQLNLLALNMNLRYIVPSEIPEDKIENQEKFDKFAENWIKARVEKLANLQFSNLDLEHLEALSCLTNMRLGSSGLKQIFENKFSKTSKFKFDYEKFIDSDLGKAIKAHWENGLQSAILTSVGQLIGIYATEMITGSSTNLSPEWSK